MEGGEDQNENYIKETKLQSQTQCPNKHNIKKNVMEKSNTIFIKKSRIRIPVFQKKKNVCQSCTRTCLKSNQSNFVGELILEYKDQ